MKTADFAAHLTEFLSHYLPELKNISTNTISSYCDAFRLFLGYCQDVEGMRIEKLSIDDLTPELVDHFLQWLRIERNNGTATRSQRLAAIRSFVKYLQIKEPRLLPLFMNRNGQKLTRAGVTYILNKYAKAASVIDPSIPEKIPPHLMRHTKAMHIYDADNDLVHVRDFLGHSDIKTTDIYARSSLTMKQKALERVSDSPVPSMPSWQKSRSTMEWLKSFGSQKA